MKVAATSQEIPKPEISVFKKIRESRRERARFAKPWTRSSRFADLGITAVIPFGKPQVGSSAN